MLVSAFRAKPAGADVGCARERFWMAGVPALRLASTRSAEMSGIPRARADTIVAPESVSQAQWHYAPRRR